MHLLEALLYGCSNFRVITANVLDIQIFLDFYGMAISFLKHVHVKMINYLLVFEKQKFHASFQKEQKSSDCTSRSVHVNPIKYR